MEDARTQQGRGKAAFREFKRELRATTKDIKASFASGFPLSPLDIQNLYDLVYIQYVRTIDEADLPNPQIWVARGEVATAKQEDDLLKSFQLARSNPFIEPIGGDLPYETEDEDTGTITTKYIPIIRGSDRLAKAGITIRKRLILPEEIEEYVSQVPYPIGVEPVYEDGILKGYRLWVQK